MAEKKFLITIRDSQDISSMAVEHALTNLNSRVIGEVMVQDVTDVTLVEQNYVTTNLPWRVLQHGSTVAATSTPEEAVAIMRGLADNLTGWSVMFNESAV